LKIRYRKGIGAWKGWFALNLINVLKEPETLEDAYYHPNIEPDFKRVQWREREKAVFEQSRSCLKVSYVYERGIQNETQRILCMSSSYWIYSSNGSGFSRSFVPVINILHSTDDDVESKKKYCWYQIPSIRAYGWNILNVELYSLGYTLMITS
jgi:hypothetical protein